MRTYPTYHVLVIGEDPVVADRIASFLSARNVGDSVSPMGGERRFDVFTCAGLAHARDVLVHWTPHVLVLVPTDEAERHAELESLRQKYPSLPVVVLTAGDGPELLLDLEAFAPALPVRPSLDMLPIANAVTAAATLSLS
jgi:DNA-binding NarL/FixJ family response regulator